MSKWTKVLSLRLCDYIQCKKVQSQNLSANNNRYISVLKFCLWFYSKEDKVDMVDIVICSFPVVKDDFCSYMTKSFTYNLYNPLQYWKVPFGMEVILFRFRWLKKKKYLWKLFLPATASNFYFPLRLSAKLIHGHLKNVYIPELLLNIVHSGYPTLKRYLKVELSNYPLSNGEISILFNWMLILVGRMAAGMSIPSFNKK